MGKQKVKSPNLDIKTKFDEVYPKSSRKVKLFIISKRLILSIQ
jgi:hypothetical protein